MDDIVKAAIAKWPNVPNCRGWLGLDARGAWRLRDEAVQAAGPFAVARGSAIGNAGCAPSSTATTASTTAVAGISRTARNAPKWSSKRRPWVWRLDGSAEAPTITAHHRHGRRSGAKRLAGRVRTPLPHDAVGPRAVHSLDMARAADAVDAGTWSPSDMPFAEMPQRFGYVLSPALLKGGTG